MSAWQINLAVLSRRPEPWSRALGQALEGAGPAPDLGLRSRSGQVLPGLVVEGRARGLVSAFDAEREAERWAEPGGTVAVFGGAGKEAAAALHAKGVRLLLWVEPRLDVWRSLMTWQDWSADVGEWIPVRTASDLAAVIARRYHPLWDGGFRTVEWRGAAAGCEALWDEHRAAAAEALEGVASDASTQARFAERWYRNALANLRELSPGSVPALAGAKAVVAGAGPGLDDALADPNRRRWLETRSEHGGRLLATDTALPALAARGVVPDLVLNLDGQMATYHHFAAQRPPSLLADLASLPLLSRLGAPVVRYLTRHPFSAVVRRHFPELPALDAPGGHVSALAWTAAGALGAGSAEAWGVDFSYRDGQAYARGTYVFDLAAKRSGRLSPLESLLGALCYGADGRERRAEAGRAFDTTPRLREYRRRWPPEPSRPVSLAHRGEEGRWPAFARDWRRRLETLPVPDGNMQAFVRTLANDVREDWQALWPLALALFRQGAESPRSVVERALSLLHD